MAALDSTPTTARRPRSTAAWRPLLLIGLGLGGSLTGWTAPAAAAKPPVVWSVDNVKQIGGYSPTVLGAPQIVREPSEAAAVFFNGKDDGLFLPVNPLAGWAQFTIEILFCPQAGGQKEQRFFHIQDSADARALLEIRLNEQGWWLDAFLFQDEGKKLALIDPARVHPANQWHWAALRYDGHRMTSFVDGEKEGEGVVDFKPMEAGLVSLGVRQNKVFWFKGGIRAVRFSPVALEPAELQRVAPKPPAARAQ